MRGLDALVLVAIGEEALAAAVGAALRANALQVIVCRRAASAIDAVSFHRPSAVVLDIGADDGRGWEVLGAVTGEAHVPLIVIDLENDQTARRAAYAAGADGVVTAPVDVEELASRVVALVRRELPESRKWPVYRHRDLVMDTAEHEVRIAGKPVALTAQQFAILRALLEGAGATLGRAQLISRIESIDREPPSDRAIDLHVSRLRHRLGDTSPHPRYIESVYGLGYRLANDGDSEAQHIGDAAAVLEALPDAIMILDQALTVRCMNRAAESLLGVPRASLIGNACASILECQSTYGASLAGPRCIGRAVLEGAGPVRDAPVTVRGPDGRLPISYTVAAVEIDGGQKLVAVTLRPKSPNSA